MRGVSEREPAIRQFVIAKNKLMSVFKSVSMRKPSRTRQEMIQLKLLILLKLGTNVGFGE